MAKEKFERTKPHVNIGTIGHAKAGGFRSGKPHYPRGIRPGLQNCGGWSRVALVPVLLGWKK